MPSRLLIAVAAPRAGGSDMEALGVEADPAGGVLAGTGRSWHGRTGGRRQAQRRTTAVGEAEGAVRRLTVTAGVEHPTVAPRSRSQSRPAW
jgi:hypothetical protein